MKTNGHNHSDLSENMQKCHDYIKGLEEERRKIQVFQRELPLCVELVTQAIETCKQQLLGTTIDYNLPGPLSECSEQTSSVVPVFEEFIPIKRASDDESNKFKIEDSSDQNCKKSEWLRSVQLWNQTPDPIATEDFGGSEVKINDGGPLKKGVNGLAETGGGNKKEGQSQRKSRRSWSPELHTRFLQALKQLGGPHVATPKQIRELMVVDGLTNDEVKSHLQKYRLHTRRPNPSTPNNNAQTPQFVVVGGIWVPPEYSSMATTTTSAEASGAAAYRKIYAPVAAPPPSFQEPPPSPEQVRHIIKQSSCSPTSSSTHTAAVSPAC